MNDSLLSVKNASGRQVSLLNMNEDKSEQSNKDSPTSFHSTEEWQLDSQQSKKKYHCIEPGCNKSFTTSGHLARHNRIHTGEKNFPCLFPGCQSRFSRQDNMMQHYRTHMSPKSRRSQKRGLVDDVKPRPKLHAHHRIRSDPVRMDPPLTIDQHLSNYHESMRHSNDESSNYTNPVERYKPVRFNFPLPLSSAAKVPPNFKKTATEVLPQKSPEEEPVVPIIVDDTPSDDHKLFYRHQPLTFTSYQQAKQDFPYTLLHPLQKRKEIQVDNNNQPQYLNQRQSPPPSPDSKSSSGNNGGGRGSASSASLLQLAHIVSSFG